MSFAVNQVIGNYECLGIIDKPQAGVTYKVRNLATGEIESLRALPGTTSRDPESVERLLREIRIQTRLSHPNIVEFHDAFEIDGRLVMTTEFLEAPTLADLCRAGDPLPHPLAIRSIIQVLDGLEQAHELGIVHRGITAEHVIITKEGAKVSGFDSAKPTSDSNLTRVGTVAGDPRYISPEQVTGQPLDARSDLYSVGVLLYQTLTGKLPFDGQSDMEILIAQVRSGPPAPRSVNPTISQELEQIVLKALKKDANQRFTSAKEFREAISAVELAQPALQAAVTAPILASSHLAAKPEHRQTLVSPLVLGTLGVAIALAAIVWLVAH
jgi:serine/threonine-protein kinase